jgi:tartronate-semialdehyde synthase
MRTVDAAVKILEIEGATQAFGLPGAAINPFYSAMRAHGGIKHVLARHVGGRQPHGRGLHAPRRETSACASAPPGRQVPT